jgi:hypothetical protein
VKNVVYLADRGGKYVLGQLDDVVQIRWGRVRDDVSECSITLFFTTERCQQLVAMADPVRHELVVERNGERVWEGPIIYKKVSGGVAQMRARDPLFFTQRTVCKRKWNSRGNKKTGKKTDTVIERTVKILKNEMRPLERAGANILDHIVRYDFPDDAKSTRVTAAYSQYVWDDMESLAARAGMDYTMVLRSLYLHDTHRFIGRSRMVTDADFLEAVEIITYGVELSVNSYATDNLGTYGKASIADDYYGPIELLATAYEVGSITDKIDKEELEEQATRNARNRYPAPTVIRLPENTQVNPETVEELFPYFIPGVAFPVQTMVTGEVYEATLKFDALTVEEDSDGERVFIRLAAAPIGAETDENGLIAP